jgi:hypothetical protein
MRHTTLKTGAPVYLEPDELNEVGAALVDRLEWQQDPEGRDATERALRHVEQVARRIFRYQLGETCGIPDDGSSGRFPTRLHP